MQNSRLQQRAWLYKMLEPSVWPARGLSPVNKAVVLLICLAAAIAILESEPTLFVGNEPLFFAMEIFLTGIFLVEYIARLWAAGENPLYRGVLGRFRYALT